MKKRIVLLLVCVLALSVFACSGGDAAAQTPATATTAPAASSSYSLELNEQVKEWKSGEKNGVSYVYAEKVMYCQNPVAGAKQCLNIYIPAAYMNTDGTLNANASVGSYTTETAPILYINSTGAYLGKAPYKITEASETLAGQNGWYYKYLKEGFVLIFSGARGRADYSSSNGDKATGKAPIGLADLKAGIRFIKHNANALPGDVNRIISNGMSAGGAMSTLLAVSGNSPAFDPYLQEIGACMDATDDVYAAQIYCPIIDLENADLAYAWYFQNDTSEKTAGMSDFQKALMASMAVDYVDYLNSLGLEVDGVEYTLGTDGRSGGFYDFIVTQYGISYEAYAGMNGLTASTEEWIVFDGEHATVTDLEAIIQNHNLRSKVTPSFDAFDKTSSENGVFGSRDSKLGGDDFTRHFSKPVTAQIEKQKDAFPSEYAEYYEAYRTDSENPETEEMVRLYNPWTYLMENNTDMAKYVRVNVGTQDSDTSPAISAALVLKLRQLGIEAEYNYIWGLGHTDADVADAFETWVHTITEGK